MQDDGRYRDCVSITKSQTLESILQKVVEGSTSAGGVVLVGPDPLFCKGYGSGKIILLDIS